MIVGPSIRLDLEIPGARRYRLYPDAEQIPSGTLTERQRVYFHLEGDGFEIFRVELSVDDEPLERSARSDSHARWSWQIGFHAGTAIVRLSGATPVPLELEVITDPDRAKLTRSEYAIMVGDILVDTLALLALAGGRDSIARGDAPVEFARFEYLRRSFDRIERAVRDIDAAPWMNLRRDTRPIAIGRARGATPAQLRQSLPTARSLTTAERERLAPRGRALADALNGRLPHTIKEPVGRVDTRRREHADILAVLGRWRGFLIRVEAALTIAPTTSSAVRARTTAAMIRRSEAMRRRLEALARLPLFDGVEPTSGAIADSHLYRRVRPYREFYRAYRDFMAGLANVRGNFLDLPLQQTFELYELWCFLRLAHAAALHSGQEDSWRDAFREQLVNGGLLLSLQARPLAFGRFTLIFQPLYREVWKTNGPRVGSFSRTMQPDIALSSGTGDAGSRPIVILDAKYRTEESINDAVGSIHMYRDAIVERAGTTEHGRVVVAGFVMTPQVEGASDVEWRDDDTPAVFFRSGYRDLFRFGAITMRPGVTVTAVRDVLIQILPTSRP